MEELKRVNKDQYMLSRLSKIDIQEELQKASLPKSDLASLVFLGEPMGNGNGVHLKERLKVEKSVVSVL